MIGDDSDQEEIHHWRALFFFKLLLTIKKTKIQYCDYMLGVQCTRYIRMYKDIVIFKVLMIHAKTQSTV